MDSEHKRKEVIVVRTALQEEDKDKMVQLRMSRQGWTQNARGRR